jgi:hypothetical protein
VLVLQILFEKLLDCALNPRQRRRSRPCRAQHEQNGRSGRRTALPSGGHEHDSALYVARLKSTAIAGGSLVGEGRKSTSMLASAALPSATSAERL